MATKLELESIQDNYEAQLEKARSAERKGDYQQVVKLAVSSFDFIDGMMQFQRKYGERDLASVEALELVFRYAPLFFDFAALQRSEALLKDCRRIEKNTAANLADKLAKARALMWDAHRLWAYLELHPEARQSELRKHLGGREAHWRSLAESWDKMNLLRRRLDGGSYRLSLVTRMGQVVSAKCASCGGVTEAPKAIFLEDMTCPACRATTSFVLLAHEGIGN